MARKSLGVAREGLIRVWQSLWKLHWLEQVTDGTLSTRWYLRKAGRGRVQVCKERDSTAPEDPVVSVLDQLMTLCTAAHSTHNYVRSHSCV